MYWNDLHVIVWGYYSQVMEKYETVLGFKQHQSHAVDRNVNVSLSLSPALSSRRGWVQLGKTSLWWWWMLCKLLVMEFHLATASSPLFDEDALQYRWLMALFLHFFVSSQPCSFSSALNFLDRPLKRVKNFFFAPLKKYFRKRTKIKKL